MNFLDDDDRGHRGGGGSAQNVNVTIQPLQVNVCQTADPQVLKKLDDLLAAIQALGADRAQLAQITTDMQAHTNALKAAVDAANKQTP